MTHRLVIRNARIVDGSGQPSYPGDIAIEDDRIVAVGEVADFDDAKTIDAGGKVVSPGFIEIHTHYDPQICWDRTASPAGEHGVTTVVMGNCGLSLAPVRPGFGERITKMFNKIEDIDTRFFDEAVSYRWTSFREYLASIRDGLGVNIAPVDGHSIMRNYVMGEAAQQRTATDAEIAAMCAELRDAIAAGAFGLSMSYRHLTDDRDQPMASSFADTKERIALARTVVEGGRLYVQTTLAQSDMVERYREFDELGEISLATGATCSALAVMQQPHLPDSYRNDLAKLAELQAKGANVRGQTMTRPLDFSFRLTKANALLYLVPVWSEIMLQTPGQRKATLADKSLWPELDAALRNYVPGQDIIGFFRVKIAETSNNRKYVGRSLAEIGHAEGISSCEAMLRIALADDFETLFDMTGMVHGNNDIVSELLDHPLIQMGGSDAGAHVAQFAGEGDATYMLQHFVRDLGKLSLERAIQRMTSDIARDFGIKDRGSIEPGQFADLVIFDPHRVERGPEILVRDLPGDGERFVRQAKGIDKVLVNGRVFVDRGQYTDARAGRTV